SARRALRERRARPRSFRTACEAAFGHAKSTMGARRMITRREALQMLGLAVAGSTLGSLAAACQVPAPPAVTAPREPTAVPTPAPTEIAAMPALRVAIEVDPDTLDPAGQTNPTTSSIVDHITETLVRLQPDGTIGPGLARKFTQSLDGRTLTFEL